MEPRVSVAEGWLLEEMSYMMLVTGLDNSKYKVEEQLRYKQPVRRVGRSSKMDGYGERYKKRRRDEKRVVEDMSGKEISTLLSL